MSRNTTTTSYALLQQPWMESMVYETLLLSLDNNNNIDNSNVNDERNTDDYHSTSSCWSSRMIRTTTTTTNTNTTSTASGKKDQKNTFHQHHRPKIVQVLAISKTKCTIGGGNNHHHHHHYDHRNSSSSSSSSNNNNNNEQAVVVVPSFLHVTDGTTSMIVRCCRPKTPGSNTGSYCTIENDDTDTTTATTTTTTTTMRTAATMSYHSDIGPGSMIRIHDWEVLVTTTTTTTRHSRNNNDTTDDNNNNDDDVDDDTDVLFCNYAHVHSNPKTTLLSIPHASALSSVLYKRRSTSTTTSTTATSPNHGKLLKSIYIQLHAPYVVLGKCSIATTTTTTTSLLPVLDAIDIRRAILCIEEKYSNSSLSSSSTLQLLQQQQQHFSRNKSNNLVIQRNNADYNNDDDNHSRTKSASTNHNITTTWIRTKMTASSVAPIIIADNNNNTTNDITSTVPIANIQSLFEEIGIDRTNDNNNNDDVEVTSKQHKQDFWSFIASIDGARSICSTNSSTNTTYDDNSKYNNTNRYSNSNTNNNRYASNSKQQSQHHHQVDDDKMLKDDTEINILCDDDSDDDNDSIQNNDRNTTAAAATTTTTTRVIPIGNIQNLFEIEQNDNHPDYHHHHHHGDDTNKNILQEICRMATIQQQQQQHLNSTTTNTKSSTILDKSDVQNTRSNSITATTIEVIDEPSSSSSNLLIDEPFSNNEKENIVRCTDVDAVHVELSSTKTITAKTKSTAPKPVKDDIVEEDDNDDDEPDIGISSMLIESSQTDNYDDEDDADDTNHSIDNDEAMTVIESQNHSVQNDGNDSSQGNVNENIDSMPGQAMEMTDTIDMTQHIDVNESSVNQNQDEMECTAQQQLAELLLSMQSFEHEQQLPKTGNVDYSELMERQKRKDSSLTINLTEIEEIEVISIHSTDDEDDMNDVLETQCPVSLGIEDDEVLQTQQQQQQQQDGIPHTETSENRNILLVNNVMSSNKQEIQEEVEDDVLETQPIVANGTVAPDGDEVPDTHQHHSNSVIPAIAIENSDSFQCNSKSPDNEDNINNNVDGFETQSVTVNVTTIDDDEIMDTHQYQQQQQHLGTTSPVAIGENFDDRSENKKNPIGDASSNARLEDEVLETEVLVANVNTTDGDTVMISQLQQHSDTDIPIAEQENYDSLEANDNSPLIDRSIDNTIDDKGFETQVDLTNDLTTDDDEIMDTQPYQQQHQQILNSATPLAIDENFDDRPENNKNPIVAVSSSARLEDEVIETEVLIANVTATDGNKVMFSQQQHLDSDIPMAAQENFDSLEANDNRPIIDRSIDDIIDDKGFETHVDESSDLATDDDEIIDTQPYQQQQQQLQQLNTGIAPGTEEDVDDLQANEKSAVADIKNIDDIEVEVSQTQNPNGNSTGTKGDEVNTNTELEQLTLQEQHFDKSASKTDNDGVLFTDEVAGSMSVTNEVTFGVEGSIENDQLIHEIDTGSQSLRVQVIDKHKDSEIDTEISESLYGIESQLQQDDKYSKLDTEHAKNRIYVPMIRKENDDDDDDDMLETQITFKVTSENVQLETVNDDTMPGGISTAKQVSESRNSPFSESGESIPFSNQSRSKAVLEVEHIPKPSKKRLLVQYPVNSIQQRNSIHHDPISTTTGRTNSNNSGMGVRNTNQPVAEQMKRNNTTMTITDDVDTMPKQEQQQHYRDNETTKTVKQLPKRRKKELRFGGDALRILLFDD